MVRHSLPPTEQAQVSHGLTTSTIDLLIIFVTENPLFYSIFFHSILFYIQYITQLWSVWDYIYGEEQCERLQRRTGGVQIGGSPFSVLRVKAAFLAP